MRYLTRISGLVFLNVSLFAAPLVSPSELKGPVEKSLALLQGASTTFFRDGGCAGCHHQQMTAIAVGVARDRAVKYDEKAAAEQLKILR
ncbi:MAG TPA: hypothetical protein VMZ52_08900, partial [Bryobacteraceae bacterium]|nr:hypothetical protein [Bryobacteraceae bacterium]